MTMITVTMADDYHSIIKATTSPVLFLIKCYLREEGKGTLRERGRGFFPRLILGGRFILFQASERRLSEKKAPEVGAGGNPGDKKLSHFGQCRATIVRCRWNLHGTMNFLFSLTKIYGSTLNGSCFGR